MIRHKFIEAVKRMWIPGSFLTTPGSGRGPSGGAVMRPDECDSMWTRCSLERLLQCGRKTVSRHLSQDNLNSEDILLSEARLLNLRE
jgi:hypothetical protein